MCAVRLSALHLPAGEIDLLLARALNRIGVEKNAALRADFADLAHRLAHAGLVVGAHDRDEHRVGPDRAREVVRIDQALGIRRRDR